MAALIASLALLPAPAPTEAQTTAASPLYLIWSATLTVEEFGQNLGCDSSESPPDDCETALSEHRFTHINGRSYQIGQLFIHHSPRFLGLAFEFEPFPNEIQTRGRLSIDGADFDFADGEEPSGGLQRWLNPGITWTAGQTVSVSLHAPIPDRLRESYDWCFNRMSGQACADAIGRWESEAEEIDLPDSGHCPNTHQIRTATTGDVKCERTFAPANPHYDTAGPSEPMRHDDDGNWADGSRAYTGDPRGCNTNGHPYYVLPRDRWHGPRRGCHKHDSGDHHEHGVGKHGSGPAGLDQLTRPS